MSACIRCGMPPERGERLCAECRRLSDVLLDSMDARGVVRPPPMPPAPQPSEEWTATVDGRISRLEDEVHALRAQLAALADRTAELLREAAERRPA